MKSGAAIIANKNQAYEYVLGDAGLLIDGRNPYKIADAMYKLINEPQLREELGKKAYERSKRFSWDKTAGKIYSILKGVYEGSKKS